MVLAGTGNDTEYTAIVTQLRSAWDDQDLRERDRGGKSFGESSSCAENVFSEQSQALALISDEANRTLAQARSAVASAKQNRSGFFPSSNVSSSRKGKGKGKPKGKSTDSSCLICGRSDHFWRQCPEQQSKVSGKGGKNESRTFYFGAAWSFGSELFETVVLQADVVLDCGGTETAGGVEAVQILVDAVKQGFSDSRVEVDSLDRPWFRFANGHWSRALSRVWLLTPVGWISIYTLDAENVPVLAGMNLLENHDISYRRNEFLVNDAEGHTRSAPTKTLSVRSSNSESADIGTARRVVFL